MNSRDSTPFSLLWACVAIRFPRQDKLELLRANCRPMRRRGGGGKSFRLSQAKKQLRGQGSKKVEKGCRFAFSRLRFAGE